MASKRAWICPLGTSGFGSAPTGHLPRVQKQTLSVSIVVNFCQLADEKGKTANCAVPPHLTLSKGEDDGRPGNLDRPA